MNEKINNKKNVLLDTGNDPLKATSIENLILNIRGRQVILDRDLAVLYGVETKRLNEQVKRNMERFPEDFMFELTTEECSRSQIATLNGRGQNIKYMPYAFTENGIAMLSGVLRSQTAIAVNISIMRAFTAMRTFIINNAQIFQRLDRMEVKQLETDQKIDEIFDQIERPNQPPLEGIFFNGQIFDAYVFISKLIKKANKSIVLIDNYIDETVLTLLDKRTNGVSATIYTQQIMRQLQLDIEKHNAQYSPIIVKQFAHAHDRFLIIDNDVYHIGASIKDLGKKWTAFALMRDLTQTDIINRIK